jgi:hypothetical protein
MQVFRINTSAWEKEDFYLMTSLSESQIKKALAPMIKNERENGEFYDNDDYLFELKKQFPREDIRMYDEFETITF